MLIRLAYIKRGTIGDGIELDPEFDVELLPHRGDHVVLPRNLCKKIADFQCGGNWASSIYPIRFEVRQVEHRWEGLAVPAWHVYLTAMPMPPDPFEVAETERKTQ